MNNDFWVTGEANAILCPEHTFPLKTITDRWFRHCIVATDGPFWLCIVTSPQLICDVRRTWGTCMCIVTSYSSIVLARANWRKGDLHTWITTVNFDFLPPGIHGLACKKSLSSSKPAHSRLSLCVKLTLFCNSTKYVLMTVQWPILIIMYAITLSNTKKKKTLSKRFLSTAGQILWRDDKNIKFVKLVLV